MNPRVWRSICALILVVVIALTAVGCALGKTTIEDEIKIGEDAAKEIEKKFPLTENKEWLADIDQLGSLLTPHVNRKGIPYKFRIIREVVDGKHQIDAFSLPGGPVYFSERMWRLLTRDERLGVLAHEIAHIDKRHAIDTISEMNKRNVLAAVILIITGTRKRGWWDAADIANTLYTLKYSRKREREADMLAMNMTVAAKESPAGLVTAMKKILRMEKDVGSKPIKLLSTHPDTRARVEYLTDRTLALGLKPEDLELKFVDQPDRIGDVVSRGKEATAITVSATRDLVPKETLWIKKPLWDDASDSVIPKPIAKGVAVGAGRRVDVSVTMEPGFEYIDIEPGDGVYPREPDPAPPPPAQ